MSRFQRLFRKNHSYSRPSKKKTEKPCYRRINIFVCVFIFLLIISYLFQVNGLTNLGYAVRELESKVDDLGVANDKLEIKAAELQSISRIREEATNLGFTEIDNIKYIDNNELTIAVVK